MAIFTVLYSVELWESFTELLAKGINPAISTKTTLNDLYEQFQDRTDVKPTSLAVYRSSYERHAKTTIGHYSLDELTYVIMLKFYQSILPCSKSTLRIASAMPTYLLNVAIKNDIITKNVSILAFEDVIKGGIDIQKEVNALTEREERELLKYLKAHIQENQCELIYFLLGTGCRVGEALALTWDNVDLEEGEIYINSNAVRVNVDHKTTTLLGDPKSRSGRRIIPLNDDVWDLLYNRKIALEKAEATKLAKAKHSIKAYNKYEEKSPQTSNLVFESSRGGIMDASTVYKALQKHIKKANAEGYRIPIVSVHALRHTFCTRLCENSDDIKTIETIMGHGSAAVTMDVYNETNENRKRRTIKKIGMPS